MYPEDRVLVALVPRPRDFALVQSERWYRIPLDHAPKGMFAEYIAFYFGRHFGAQKWSIYYYARNLGHELVRRRDLFPQETEHPRADQPYYKVQLGPILQREEPIISLRWRRVTFIHTTWDRFEDAREINDLFIEGAQYVDRVYATLKERGIWAVRNFRVSEARMPYIVPLMIPCRYGRIDLTESDLPHSEEDILSLVERVIQESKQKGGVISEGKHGQAN